MRSTTLAAELAVATSALASSDVKVDVQTTIEPMPPLIEVALAYIVREAATNVIRHAGSSSGPRVDSIQMSPCSSSLPVFMVLR